ncbi:MAG: hypothetical protein M1839_003484 [Geoglossum umbratile]|nr:MAG: hypothetical protein M1839_003484 [Geoglossum umbratile]
MSSSDSTPRKRVPRRRGSSDTDKNNADKQVQPRVAQQTPNFGSKGQLQLETPSKFDILSFVTFLGKRRVEIIKEDDLDLSDDPHPVLEGASMRVQRAKWKSVPVVIKRNKRFLRDGASERDSIDSYNAFMNDIIFEIQVMFHKPLCDHRNIVRLIGLSFENESNIPGIVGADHVMPILVVEPAHDRFPDLEIYFSIVKDVAFETVAELVADIADGLRELHAYGVVHADLKPANSEFGVCNQLPEQNLRVVNTVLLFPDPTVPTKLVAKLADFGYSGISPINAAPRGGTSEWNAPESLRNCPDSSLRAFSGTFTRDIYSFGLVAMFIALNGADPILPSQHAEIKFKNEAASLAIRNLRALRYPTSGTGKSISSRWAVFEEVAETTLQVQPLNRVQSLGHIRELLLGRGENAALQTQQEALRLAFQNLTHDDEHGGDSSQYVHYIYPSLPPYLKTQIAHSYRANVLEMSQESNTNGFGNLGYQLADEGYVDLDLVKAVDEKSLRRHIERLPSIGSTSVLRSDEIQKLYMGLRADTEAAAEFPDSEDPVYMALKLGTPVLARHYLASQDRRGALQRRTKSGWSFLHLAAYLNKPDFIRLFVEHGLDPDLKAGPQRHTPLHEAAREGHKECVQNLLALGADVDGGTFRALGADYSPLSLAVTFALGSENGVEISKMLLEKGAKVHGHSFHRPLIHCALKSPVILKLLLQKRPDLVNVRDPQHVTPLEECVTFLNVDAAKILVENGADVNTRSSTNATPLHSLFALVQGLTDLGFFCEFARRLGPTFEYRIENHREMIRLLIENGADVDAESDTPGKAEYPGQSLTPEAAMWNDAMYCSEDDLLITEAKLEPKSIWYIQERYESLRVFHPVRDSVTHKEHTARAFLKPTTRAFSISKILPSVYPHHYELFALIGRVDCGYSSFSLELEITMLRPNLARIETKVLLNETFDTSKLLPEPGVAYTLKLANFHIGHMAPVLVVLKGGQGASKGGLFLDWIKMRRARRPHDVKLGETFVQSDLAPELVELMGKEPQQSDEQDEAKEELELPYPEDLDLLSLLFPDEDSVEDSG